MKLVSILKKVIFVILVFSIFILVLESLLKSFYGKYNLVSNWTGPDDYIPNRQLIYSGAKNADYTNSTNEYREHSTTNSLGFRDNEILKKNPTTFRILVVGDSFTFGHGLSSNSKTYPKQLEAFLQTREDMEGQKIEVFNLGIKGYSPDQEYRFITSQILPLEPNMVIWTLSNPGDIYNLVHISEWPTPSLYNVDNGKLIPLDARFNWLYLGKYIKQRSPSFIYKSYIFNLFIYSLSQIQLFSRKPYYSDEKSFDWALSKVKLEIVDAHKQLSNRSIQLIIAVLPYPELFRAKQYAPIEKISRLFDELRKKNVDIIDVKSEMTSDQKTTWKKYFFTTDSHPNNLGAQLFAQIIGNRIFKYIQLH
jgi:hypothetical protein